SYRAARKGVAAAGEPFLHKISQQLYRCLFIIFINMALSEADKQRIVEEEQLRAKARAEAEAKHKKKGTSCFTWIVFFLIIGCFLAFLFSKAFNDQVSEN